MSAAGFYVMLRMRKYVNSNVVKNNLFEFNLCLIFLLPIIAWCCGSYKAFCISRPHCSPQPN